MTNEQIEQLLWKRRDGELSDEEAAILEQVLAESAEARELAREVDGVAERLEGIATGASPADLRERIDAALSAAEDSSNAPVPSSPRTFRRRWRHAPMIRYAALAATLAVVVVGGWIVSSRRPPASDGSQYAGTIEKSPGFGGTSQSFHLREALGTLTVRHEPGRLLVDLDVSKKGKVEVNARMSGQAGASIKIVRFEGPGQTTPQTTPGTVSWVVSAPGHFSMTVALEPLDAGVDLAVSFGGREVFHKSLLGSRQGS